MRDYDTPEEARLAVMDGVVAASERWLDVMATIVESHNRSDARASVQRLLGVEEDVAEHVLDLRLMLFNRDSREDLRRQRDELRDEIEKQG